jgi:hypothetical protein
VNANSALLLRHHSDEPAGRNERNERVEAHQRADGNEDMGDLAGDRLRRL